MCSHESNFRLWYRQTANFCRIYQKLHTFFTFSLNSFHSVYFHLFFVSVYVLFFGSSFEYPSSCSLFLSFMSSLALILPFSLFIFLWTTIQLHLKSVRGFMLYAILLYSNCCSRACTCKNNSVDSILFVLSHFLLMYILNLALYLFKTHLINMLIFRQMQRECHIIYHTIRHAFLWS